MVTPLPLDRARRIVLAAQCFGASREQPPSGRRANHVIRRLAQFQIDSVNVFTRAQTMPLFSRLGAYSPAALEQGGLYEYWGHAASLIDVNLYPHFGFRRAEAGERPWAEIRQLMAEQPKLVDAVLAEVAARGPITAREISLGRSKNASGWWEWSDAKTVLEWLLLRGDIAVASRNSQFERLYDLTERVVPRALWAADATDRLTAHRALAARAASALGVATAAHLADYFRTNVAETRVAAESLAADSQLERIAVEGWRHPAYLSPNTPRPRAQTANCLVSPFDNLVFERRRLRDLFGVDYRISLYTPAARRVHGYYVYLFLMGCQFAARVDLKADRRRGRLLVRSAWLEEGPPPRPQSPQLRRWPPSCGAPRIGRACPKSKSRTRGPSPETCAER